jgi:uncharacterized protein YdgA (DUF945 family)
MKKIFGSIVTALAVWAGTTAYIGSQMEESLQKHFDHTNELYASNGIKYKINHYEKSFLNSKATVEVEFTDPAVAEILKDTIKLPLVMDYNIEHGPLFFQNGFGVGAAKTHQKIPLSSLLSEEAKEEFLSLIKEDVTLTSDLIISFANNAVFNISSDSINIKKEGNSFMMAPLSAKGNMNLDSFSGTSSMNIASLEIKEDKSQNGLKIDNLQIGVDIDEFIENSLMAGEIEMSVENLSIKDDNNPQLENINIAGDMHIVTKKDSKSTLSTMIDGDIDFKKSKLPDNLPPLKNIHASMNMNSVGIEGLMEFQKVTQEMQDTQSKLFSKMQSNSSEEDMQKIFKEFESLQKSMMEKMVHALNTLLVKDKTRIGYAFEIETKDKQKSSANLEMGYTGDIKFEGSMEDIAMKVQQEALNIANLDVNIALSDEHIKSLPNAEILRQQIQMGVAQGFVKKESGKYILNGYYKNRELMVNDNNLTATVLPLLMMVTQGRGF